MLRAALGSTPAATSATHGAGCTNQWRNSSFLAGHSTLDLARHSGEGGGNSRPPHAQQLRGLLSDAAPSSSSHARPARMVAACACARGGREGPPHAAAAGGRIQLAVGPQPLWLRNHKSGLAHRIMVKRLATSPHDLLGITNSARKNHLVVVSVQYGPFNPYIPIRSTTIGKSRVAIDPIAMHTSWRSNSDIASVASPSQLGGRHSNPAVTTPMIALDFSGTTHLSSSHNVALNQVINQSVNQAQDNQPSRFITLNTAMSTLKVVRVAPIRTSILKIYLTDFKTGAANPRSNQPDFCKRHGTPQPAQICS
ncbi:hypothetical protein F511_24119 [Dorcoceras hygrometricum]|uniref:Uncharacterized protein n=1 Tax=Dorcoceras hygrometricum TaxID=472368 RepID=A0A2Z7D7Q1_9LAMI|nr:hypothetical protein F511_24119 [Dorcoceras hygrometricum]